MFTGRASDYAKYIKDRDRNIDGVSKWTEYFLKPAEENYSAGLDAITKSFDYDVSSAYAQFKKSQLNIQASNTWSGEKNKFSNYLADSYSSTFADANQNRYNKYSELTNAFSESLREEDNRLLEVGQKYVDFERMAYDYYKTKDSSFDPTNDDIMSKYYSYDSNGVASLNEEGVDFWDKLLNAPREKDPETGEFTDSYNLEGYLYENDKDMYDFYQENKGDIREMVGGLSKEDFQYNVSERRTRLDAEKTAKTATTEFAAYSDKYSGDAPATTEDYVKVNSVLKAVDGYVTNPSVSPGYGYTQVEFNGKSFKYQEGDETRALGLLVGKDWKNAAKGSVITKNGVSWYVISKYQAIKLKG